MPRRGLLLVALLLCPGALSAQWIGLAALTAGWGRSVAALAIVVCLAVSVAGLFGQLPLENRFMRRQIARVPTREAYRAIAAQRDVVAVLDASATNPDSPWYLTP